MNERIKKLRKSLDLTQKAFAERLGMKQNSIAQIEMGRNTSDQTIRIICQEFNVNEAWLRTGKGEMFNKTENSVVEQLCAELNATELEAKIIRLYFQIDPAIRDSFIKSAVKQALTEYAAQTGSASAAYRPVTTDGEIEDEARQEAERYYHRLLHEKHPASQTLSVNESGVG